MITNKKCVCVHCGSGHVKGKARRYPYYIASLYEIEKTLKGYYIWVYSGKDKTPRRSIRKAQNDAFDLSQEYNCLLKYVYGSIHNKKVTIEELLL